jgi:hypothetical protein
VPAIASATGLKELLVPGCNFVRAAGVQALTTLTGLTRLHISGSYLETKVCMASLSLMLWLKLPPSPINVVGWSCPIEVVPLSY